MTATKRGKGWIFRLTLPICAVVAIVGIWSPATLEGSAAAATGAVFRALDWFLMAATTGLILLGVWLALGRYRNVRLGAPHERPEFSTVSWLAMLFSAGMGVGILFWGVAEPITHFLGAPGSLPETPAAARRAQVLTMFHWGFHAWTIYAISGLVLAYFTFRRKTPYLPGSPLRDTFSGRWVRPVAFTADFTAVLAVAFGVAGAMTMGAIQLQAGADVFGIADRDSLAAAAVIIVVLMVAYTASAATSLDKGIKWLSNINTGVAVALCLFLIVAGPTAYIFKSFITNVGDYLAGLPSLSLRLFPYEANQDWIHSWTLNYLIWWIAWAPFVGIFIARISRGRTIQEFIFGVIVVPTLFSTLWFAVFGGSALFEEMHGNGGVAAMVREDVTVALFALFDTLPLSALLSATAMLLVFVFLVTSVDSATYVLGMLTSEGSEDPPRTRKLAWGFALGIFAFALRSTNNVDAVKSVAILGALPFTLILLLQVVALVRRLREDIGDSE